MAMVLLCSGWKPSDVKARVGHGEEDAAREEGAMMATVASMAVQ